MSEKTLKLVQRLGLAYPAVVNITARGEILGGVICALLLYYAPILNAGILSATGMPLGALMTTTIILTMLFTLANGLYAKVPFAQSVYMGENAFFAFALVVIGKIPWQTALGIVFWAGILFFIITATGLRKKLATVTPRELGLTWGFAVAIFLLYLALFNGGLFLKNPVEGLPTIPGNYRSLGVITFLLLSVLIVLMYKKLPKGVRGIGILLSIIIALLIGPSFFGLEMPGLSFGIADPSPIVMKLNFIEAWQYPHFILIFLLIELVDVTGTLKALVTPLKLRNEEQVIERVMHTEGISTAVGAMLGQPTVGTYIESGGAVAAGAKTGLASIVTALLFIPMLLLTPFFEKFPSWFLLWATAPALAAVSGFILMNVFSEIDFKKTPETAILLLTTLPGVLGANLLLAFAVPMATIAGYEYLTKGKTSTGSMIITILGLIVLALYHY